MPGITSNYLGILKKIGKIEDITDGVVIIPTIIISQEPEIPSYQRPKLIYDKFSEEQELMEPEIKKIAQSIVPVHELGIDLVSVNVKRRWRKRQVVEYKIRKKNMVSDGATLLNSMPVNHYVEYDMANERIRLVGPNCRNIETGALSTTEWLSL